MHVKQVLSERLAALLREQISASGYRSLGQSVCLCAAGRARFVSRHCN